MTSIVILYSCQIEPEIRSFRVKKFNIHVQTTPSRNFATSVKNFIKGAENEVSLTDILWLDWCISSMCIQI